MFAIGRIEDSWMEQIRSEVNWIVNSQASSDVTRKDHITNWTRPTGVAKQYSLLNRTGKSDDFSSDHSFALEGKKLAFPDLKGIERFAKLFGPNLINLRLNGLGKSSGLGAHEEKPIQATSTGHLNYKIRFHLPIYTNPSVRICLDGEQFHFDEGILYFFNQSCVHAAINNGEEVRYHFVLDALLDKKLQQELLSLSGNPAGDKGLKTFDAAESERYSKSEPWHPDDFMTESGAKMTRLDYGRKAVKPLDYHRVRHPSVFAKVDRLLGREPRDLSL